jgi:hypothetical protein
VTWHKVTVTNGNLGVEKQRALEEFMKVVLGLKTQAPENMALFATAHPSTILELFYSPQCFPVFQVLVSARKGQPCDRPSPDGLSKLANGPGQGDPWDFHLGGHPKSEL